MLSRLVLEGVVRWVSGRLGDGSLLGDGEHEGHLHSDVASDARGSASVGEAVLIFFYGLSRMPM